MVGLGLTLLVLLALTAQRPTDPLDPESPGSSGAMALVEVLRQQGVEVEIVRSIGALEASRPDGDTTVVVGDPTYLGRGATERLAEATSSAGRLVLVGVDSDQLDVLGLPVTAFPGCRRRPRRRGARRASPSTATSCGPSTPATSSTTAPRPPVA